MYVCVKFNHSIITFHLKLYYKKPDWAMLH